MAKKGYYTVIVGTQPGVYADWIQAGPTVSEISGALHRKYKTPREAWEAFDRAAREGKVRAIEADPPDAFGGPAPVPDYHLQRDSHQNAPCHQDAPPTSVGSTHHSATRPRRRNPGSRSRNTSSPVSAPNADLVTSIGVGPLRRPTHEYDGNSRQPLRTMPDYVDSSGSFSSLSSPSRPAGRSQVHEHVELPSNKFRWLDENWQNGEQGRTTRESPRSSRSGHLTHGVSGDSQGEDVSGTAARTHRQLTDPFPASTARTRIGEGQKSRSRVFNFLYGLRRSQDQRGDNSKRRASLQSVDTFLDSSDGMQRVQSSHNQLQTRAAPILSRPSSACSHISLVSSTESTLSFEVDLTQSKEPENLASPTPPPTSCGDFFTPSSLAEDIVYRPSTPSKDDLNDGDRGVVPSRRASSSQSGNRESARGTLSPLEDVHSQFDHPNAGDDILLSLTQPLSPQLAASTFTTPTHFRTQNIRRSPEDPSASSPRDVWPTSPLSHYSFELSATPASSGLGLLTGVASPHRQPLPQSPAVQTFSASPVNRSARSTDAESPMRNTESSRNVPEQAHASSPHLSTATPEDAQSVRTRPIDCGSISHHSVPLPPSPFSSASNSSARLQVQPGHRRNPRRSLYPSLASADPELLSPSGLDGVFGLPTPGFSPIQTPALIRSPSMDPRSPVPSQMRIPGDIMGTIFFGRPTPPTNNTQMIP
ncbi:hypothetical protein EI94DRAFT_1713808 [Lactarius quietus]|nr:hypothetical protein EI94DRAFT_1713808 [Lactarius quietus]